jgi:hypothetical protein
VVVVASQSTKLQQLATIFDIVCVVQAEGEILLPTH